VKSSTRTSRQVWIASAAALIAAIEAAPDPHAAGRAVAAAFVVL